MGNRLSISRRVLRYFGYDAIKDTKRRKSPRSINYSEDNTLPDWARKRLTATVRDVQRNFAVASWAIRKHLDYVSSFSFQSKTGNEAFDRRLEELMAWWSLPENCDVRKRDSLSRLTRIAEQSRTIDGDVFLVRLKTGQIQAIESDRVCDARGGGALPEGISADNVVQGVILGPGGAAQGYVVNQRRKNYAGSMTFEKVVSARNCYHLGYFDRFDQIRGVSRLAAAINTFQDLYEGLTYAICKAKVTQLFGLVTYRDATEALGNLDEEENADGSKDYSENMGKGIFHLDLEDGDKAEILESKSPSTELQEFSQIMIALALKSVDLPFSFYAENFSNYSGSRQALLQYQQSAEAKRQEVRGFLDWVTFWKIATWVSVGLLRLPAGASVRDVRWEWIPKGIPWIDPLKEVKANVAAIDAGIMSRQMVAKSTGADWFDILKQLEQEDQAMRAAKLSGDESGRGALEAIADSMADRISESIGQRDEPQGERG